MLKQTDSCLLLFNKQPPFDLLFLNYNHSSHSYEPDDFSLGPLGNITYNSSNPAAWSISKSCDKIKFFEHQFKKRPDGTWDLMNNAVQNVTFNYFDESMEFGIGADDSLYRYDANTGGYDLFYSFTRPLPFGMDISIHQDRLVINGTDSTSAWVEAYHVSAAGELHESFKY